MRDVLTTVLDALALLLVAAGLAATAFPFIGWASLAVAGVVVLTGSWVSSWQARPKAPKS
jgi:hypothetical protein